VRADEAAALLTEYNDSSPESHTAEQQQPYGLPDLMMGAAGTPPVASGYKTGSAGSSSGYNANGNYVGGAAVRSGAGDAAAGTTGPARIPGADYIVNGTARAPGIASRTAASKAASVASGSVSSNRPPAAASSKAPLAPATGKAAAAAAASQAAKQRSKNAFSMLEDDADDADVAVDDEEEDDNGHDGEGRDDGEFGGVSDEHIAIEQLEGRELGSKAVGGGGSAHPQAPHVSAAVTAAGASSGAAIKSGPTPSPPPTVLPVPRLPNTGVGFDAAAK
jgi:hypothetical protein